MGKCKPDPRYEVVSLRVTETEKKALIALAAIRNKPVQEIIRVAVSRTFGILEVSP